MALFGAYALSKIKLKWLRILILIIVAVESILNQQYDFRIKEEHKHLIGLEAIADEVSDKSDLIIINGGKVPIDIYYTHRKGWSLENQQIFDHDLLTDLMEKGCKFIFVDKHLYEGELPEINYEIVYEDEDFRVYKLEYN
jgi:hypothetical protein